jgi:hypothetical protein
MGSLHRRVAAAVLALGALLAGCASPGAAPEGQQRARASSSTGPPPSSGRATSSTVATSGASENLLTYGYGNARDGTGPNSPSLGGIGRSPRWRQVLSAGVYGQPLVDGRLVIVATEDDVVDAFDTATGKRAWSFSIGDPAQQSAVQSAPTLSNSCGDIFPLGITGTPVIDPTTSEIFVAGEVQRAGTSGWAGIEHVMAAASFTFTSARTRWIREIDPPGAGSRYLIPAELQRSSLTLTGGRVYAEYGGLSGDCGRYTGYVVSLPVTGSGPLACFRVPTSREGAIWAPGGASVGQNGELYVATGNSANESAGQPFDYGDAVIGLTSRAGRLEVDSYFAPSGWRAFNLKDRDLGSAGPVVLPGGKLIFEIGKTPPNGVSTGYLLDPAALGGIGNPLYSGSVCPDGGSVFGAEATTELTVKARHVTYIFVPCPSGTVALTLKGSTAAPSFSVAWVAPQAAEGNGPPVLAGGLVWSLATGANGGGGGFALYGLNPRTGALVVARATAPLEHFATPGAGDGSIFVPTTDGLEAFAPAS